MAFAFQIDRLAGHAGALLIVPAFIATIGLAQADTKAPDADVAARNEAVVRAAFERWTVGGNVFEGLLSPDVVWTIHGSGPVAATYRGIEDFTERAAVPLVSRLATPLVPEVPRIWTDGDGVVIRFDASAITTSGMPYSNRFVWIFRMEDGTVVEAEAFLDLVAYQAVIDGNEPRKP